MNYKLRNFNTLPGQSDLDRLAYMHKELGPNAVFVQEKLNGVSARFYNNTMFTRQNKTWRRAAFPPLFWDELRRISSSLNNDIMLFGELTVDGLPFQTAVGELSVNRTKVSEHTDKFRFTLFDIFRPFEYSINQPFKKRLELLSQIEFGHHITTATTMFSAAPDASEKIFQFFTASSNSQQKEGVVYYCGDALLISGQSTDIIKRKKYFEEEGICTAVLPGVGKRAGMLGCLVVSTPNGRQVNIGGGAGMDDKLLTRLWKRPPIGLPITYRYDELSKDGVPLRPQFMAVRNYE